MKFLHFGVPVDTKKEASTFLSELGVHVTDPAADPCMVEWLFFEPDSNMHELIKTKPHVAYQVEDLDAAMAGKKVICQPFSGGPGIRLAFIDHDGIAIELMEAK